MKLIDSADVPLNRDLDTNLAIETVSQSNNPNKKDLLNGASVKLDNPILEGPRLIATLRTIADEYLHDGAPDYFTIIDLRGVPAVDGYKVFDGQKVHPSTQYLIIDPMQLDWNKGLGYKGVYSGDTIKIGRFDPTKELNVDEKIKRDRFPGLGPWTSRNHFSLSCDQDGSLTIQDLNSSNGSALAQGDAAIDLLLDGENRRKIEDMIKPVGETAVESQITPGLITAESRPVVPMLNQEDSRLITSEIVNPSNPEINRELIANFPELTPRFEVNVEGEKYLFSSLIEMSSGRLHAIAFVEVGGRLVPRLFYKSKSEGGWRSCPGWEKSNRRYSKGPVEIDGGYVQVTKPVEELVQGLENISVAPDSTIHISKERGVALLDAFDLASDEIDEIDTFDQEISVARLDERVSGGVYDSYEPGIGFKQSPDASRLKLENMDLPPGFEPDFSQDPTKIFNITHTIAGLTKVSVYKATYLNRPIEWHMAQSESGSFWIDSIRFSDSENTSYGTPSEIILAGALNCKPFDYAQQTDGMEPGIDYDWINGEHGSTYVSMQKTIDRFPPIKRFRETLSKKR